MVIHGGAGVILKENLSEELEEAYLKVMNEALNIGEKILNEGGTSIDAVTSTIMHMENSPLFNAGKGAVFTHEGINEMDASIMDGKSMEAGAVGGITKVKNPILAARAVLEKSEHVMLTGLGAEKFAMEQGIERVDPSYFYTERRWNALQKLLKSEPGKVELDHSDQKHGTVGAAALDKDGNLAAGTSTGGMTNKKYNRIGDSPIIGAGTYANNATCAVSSTGHGEYFIRYAVAHAISAQMQFAHKSLSEAADFTIHKTLTGSGGTGGIIAVDYLGNVAMPFNTPGMYRGYVKPGERVVKIYQD
jgi:beta-aspartyl-peptidase (threonine type)